MPESILSAEDVYLPHSSHPDHTPAEVPVFRWWRHSVNVPAPQLGRLKGPWPTETVSSPATVARVDHNRWTIDCPFEGCNSAQYASRGDRRFFCVECGNAGTGKWVPVVWPADLDLAAIEATLLRRPLVEDRNWLPHESVADLQAENKAHGV